jgi:eukaryotic-like serine/threonine-protein kinase
MLALESTNPDVRPTPRLRGATMCDAMEAVFQKALAVQPADRYATMGEFWSALREAAGKEPLRVKANTGDPKDFFLESPTSFEPSPRAAFAPTIAATDGVDGSTHLPSPSAQPVREAPARRSPLPLVLAVAAAAAILGGAFALRPVDPPRLLPAASSGGAVPVPAASSVSSDGGCPAGMSLVPGGKFFMGNNMDMAAPSEKPEHKVSLSPFCADVTEVTVQDYQTCSSQGECPRAPTAVWWPDITPDEKKMYSPLCNAGVTGRDRHPINCVEWDMARRYCSWAGKRLPTSAEWEFSARGSDGRVYPWGDEKPDKMHLNACGRECVEAGKKLGLSLTAFYDEDDGFSGTAPVGSFPAGRSRYGLDDLVGNVMEWVEDWSAPYNREDKVDPRGPAKGTERVIRGGAFNASDQVWVRPSYRFQYPPEVRSHGIGFRCAKSL